MINIMRNQLIDKTHIFCQNQDEDAQKIVEEHQKKTKQINNMRQREKNALDAKLKKKLHVERA